MIKFSCSNKNLKSLLDIKIPLGTTHLYCYSNQLTSLEGCPNSVTDLWCSNNQLTSLKGFPNSVVYLDCSDNQLTSLKGCPNSVKYLNCSSNQLTSLEWCPNSVKELYCHDNQLTSLEGCLNSITILTCYNNNIAQGKHTIQHIHKMNFKRGFDIVNRLFTNKKAFIIQKAWKQYWLVPDANGDTRIMQRFLEDHPEIVS